MTDKTYHVFLSHSRNDPVATTDVFAQLRRYGLGVFKDDESIEPGDVWLDRLQSVLGGCGSFVVLVGRDGVRRWIGAEAQVALNRHFGPHDDAQRLPIFPILLDGTAPETLPPLLRLFQVTHWKSGEALPADLLPASAIATSTSFGTVSVRGVSVRRARQLSPGSGAPVLRPAEGDAGRARLLPPAARRPAGEVAGDQRQLRLRQVVADAGRPLAAGGAGLAVVAHRLRAMEDHRADDAGRAAGGDAGRMPWRAHSARRWPTVYRDLQGGDDALRYWLRDYKQDDTAFLLAIDQFEELFTFAEEDERRRFDRLLAAALEDPDCPLFVVSTVRADFLDRFAEELPRLVAVRNRLAGLDAGADRRRRLARDHPGSGATSPGST